MIQTNIGLEKPVHVHVSQVISKLTVNVYLKKIVSAKVKYSTKPTTSVSVTKIITGPENPGRVHATLTILKIMDNVSL